MSQHLQHQTFHELVASVEGRLHRLELANALEDARKAVEAALTPAERAQARHWVAKCHYDAGEIDVAVLLAAENSALAAEANEPLWVARAQALESRCLEAAGESQAALDLAIMALQEIDRTGRTDPEAKAAEQVAATALGVVNLQLGDLELAMHWCLRSVELADPAHNRTAYGAAKDTVACVHSALAAKARDAGELAEAERIERLAITCSEEAVEVAYRQGHIHYETTALLNLAESFTLVGEAPRAIELLEQWARRYPNAPARHRSHHKDSLGLVYMTMNRPEEAVVAFKDALAQCESGTHRVVMIEHLSQALERTGRWQEALEQYQAFHMAHVCWRRPKIDPPTAIVPIQI